MANVQKTLPSGKNPQGDDEAEEEMPLTEDEQDAAVASRILMKIKASPGMLIAGDELVKRLARLES